MSYSLCLRLLWFRCAKAFWRILNSQNTSGGLSSTAAIEIARTSSLLSHARVFQNSANAFVVCVCKIRAVEIRGREGGTHHLKRTENITPDLNVNSNDCYEGVALRCSTGDELLTV